MAGSGSTEKGESALLKHEIAFVLGQLEHPSSDRALIEAVCREDEHPMVRHEAAEAIGSIAAADTEDLLKKYRGDGDRIVAESCEVALDIMASEQAGEFVPLAPEIAA